MTQKDFMGSLSGTEPPSDLGLALTALWWDAKGDWNAAHEHVQRDEGNPACDWVHAYLHRKEGDLSNARYWYRNARRPAASGPLEQECEAIVATLTAPKAERREA